MNVNIYYIDGPILCKDLENAIYRKYKKGWMWLMLRFIIIKIKMVLFWLVNIYSHTLEMMIILINKLNINGTYN